MLRPQSLPIRSRNLYPAASMRNSGRISFDPARSAMVLATFSILEYARADNPSLSIRRSSTSLHPASRAQNLSNWRLLISAFVKIASSPNLSFWSILALSTRSATALLGSPFFRFYELRRIHLAEPELYIYSVHHWTGELRQVRKSLSRSTSAPVSGAIVAAGARVRCRDQHERSRIFKFGTEPRNSHLPVFHRPPERLQDRFRHLAEFIQEKDPILRQGHLSGSYVLPRPSSYDGWKRCNCNAAP
jgi:hypothetical protein